MLCANHTLINKLMKNYLPSILKKRLLFSLSLYRGSFTYDTTLLMLRLSLSRNCSCKYIFVSFPQDSKFLFEIKEMSRLFRCSLSTLFFFLVFYLKDTSVKPKAANIKNNPSSKCDLDFPIKNPHSFPFIDQFFFLNVVLRKCLPVFLMSRSRFIL